jgi:hypothetical protein
MSESLLNLSQYTNKNDTRIFTNKIVKIGDCLGVCNGHIIIIDETTKGKHYGFHDFHASRKIEVKEYKIESQLKSISDNLDTFDWSQMPQIKEEHYRDCNSCNDRGLVPVREVGCAECQGSGEVELENDYNTYEMECKSCAGEGDALTGCVEACGQCKGTKQHLTFVPVLIANDKWALSGEFVQSLGSLPDIRISWQEQYEYFVIKFSGGFGVVLPMRR